MLALAQPSTYQPATRTEEYYCEDVDDMGMWTDDEQVNYEEESAADIHALDVMVKTMEMNPPHDEAHHCHDDAYCQATIDAAYPDSFLMLDPSAREHVQQLVEQHAEMLADHYCANHDSIAFNTHVLLKEIEDALYQQYNLLHLSGGSWSVFCSRKCAVAFAMDHCLTK